MFNESKADHAEAFVRALTHTKGRWAGHPFALMDWQRALVRDVFGTVRPDGFRQYKTVYAEIPKKNGKSELAAAVALYCLFADNEPGAEVYSAAADREQASIVFNVAAQMVRDNPALARRAKILDSQKRIIVPATASFYKALSSDVHTKHGFNTHAVVFDEVHAQPNRELWDVMTVGSGDARTQPLYFAITTAGIDRQSVCYELHKRALDAIADPSSDPEFYPVVYSASDDDDWEDPAVWAKCNPSLITPDSPGGIITMDKIRSAYLEAKKTPAGESAFRRLRLNQWVTVESRWIRRADWDACEGEIDPETLLGRDCFLGLDMANTTDLSAAVLVFPPKGDETVYRVVPKFWVPADAIHERSHRDQVPYDSWARAGYITATPGNVTDHQRIIDDIRALARIFRIRELPYDRYGAIRIATDLKGSGIEVVEFGQGFKSMTPATNALEVAILSRAIMHNGNPVLTWNVDNTVVRHDAAGGRKPDKAKSRERIDGLVALVMAYDRALRHNGNASGSVYERRGILSVD